jgi:hypothetical protein
MATYFGNDIGDAARAEERGLERWLNLQLANRQHAAQERARRDAIEAQNAANAMNADRLGLALQADERNQGYNRSLYADERRLDLEDRDYQRKQDALELKLGLEEAEKQRQLQRELNDLRADNYTQRLQQSEDSRTFSDLAKRIAADDIRDIPSLQDAEGGRLGSEEWVDLKTRLGQRQQRMMEESAMGPERAAQEATLALLSDPYFQSAPDAAGKATAINMVMSRLGQNPVYRGKINPDYANNKFNPVLGYKYGGPRDAIDWYGAGTTPRNPAPQEPPIQPSTPPPEPSIWKRLGAGAMTVGRGISDLSQRVGSNMTGGLIPRPEDDRVVSFSRLAIDTPITAEADTTRIAPPPPPVTEDPFAKEKRRELAALLRAGMDEMQATLIVNAKYRNRSSGPIRTY